MPTYTVLAKETRVYLTEYVVEDVGSASAAVRVVEDQGIRPTGESLSEIVQVEIDNVQLADDAEEDDEAYSSWEDEEEEEPSIDEE